MNFILTINFRTKNFLSKDIPWLRSLCHGCPSSIILCLKTDYILSWNSIYSPKSFALPEESEEMDLKISTSSIYR